MGFKNFINDENGEEVINEAKSIAADYVALHTTENYDPKVTPLKKNDLTNYFDEDNGFDEEVLDEVKKLKVGGLYTDGMGFYVFRLK